jgi:hypothetical protein
MKQEDHEFKASLSYTLGQTWWYMPIVPAVWEAEMEGLGFEASVVKKTLKTEKKVIIWGV